MKVLVNSLKNELDNTKSYQVEVLPPEDLKEHIFPGDVQFTATYTGNGILITGILKSRYSTKCHRCLQPVKKEISTKFQEEFRQREYLPTDHLEDDEENVKKEVVLDKKDLSIDYFTGNELDLTDFFRQMMILAIPPKIVCDETCLGLCPKCGKNLNYEDCNCEQSEIDPRLAKLQQLKKEN